MKEHSDDCQWTHFWKDVFSREGGGGDEVAGEKSKTLRIKQK